MAENGTSILTTSTRDHGGGIDAAAAQYGGDRIDWIDLSTGINPVPYPVGDLPHDAWTALPDKAAHDRLLSAARNAWGVPEEASLIAASGASALISQLPTLTPTGWVCIPEPTYNEHAAAFTANGWKIGTSDNCTAQVIVHPNNPDGRLWSQATLPATQALLTVIDESFCDVCPEQSLVPQSLLPGTIVLKSFGKFWGLAGMRLGFAIGDAALLTPLQDRLGPWAVSGPALHIGAMALQDTEWARQTRERLLVDSARLDRLMQKAGAQVVGGTTLFRLYEVDDATAWQTRLAQHKIWSRSFPYNPYWLRLGLPAPEHWARLETALV